MSLIAAKITWLPCNSYRVDKIVFHTSVCKVLTRYDISNVPRQQLDNTDIKKNQVPVNEDKKIEE